MKIIKNAVKRGIWRGENEKFSCEYIKYKMLIRCTSDCLCPEKGLSKKDGFSS